MRRFRIYDNGSDGDRYTFVIREKDSNTLQFWGSGKDPRGLSYYCGSSQDGYQAGSHLGKKIRDISEVPELVAGFFASCCRELGWDYQADVFGRLA